MLGSGAGLCAWPVVLLFPVAVGFSIKVNAICWLELLGIVLGLVVEFALAWTASSEPFETITLGSDVFIWGFISRIASSTFDSPKSSIGIFSMKMGALFCNLQFPKERFKLVNKGVELEVSVNFKTKV